MTRLRLGLVVGVALLGFAALFAGGASAQPSDASGLTPGQSVFDPQETNVPYLAWRGEEIRLVKCIPHEAVSIDNADITETSDGFHYFDGHLDVNNQIFAYSGPQENSFDGPKTVTGTASVFYDYNTDRLCSRQTFISNKAGIVIIKNTVAYDGVILIQHDFMVGWMGINSVDIKNPGTVTELPGAEPGNSVNVQVTGAIPLNSQFQADYGLPATLVMPNDWAMWANAMATTDGNLSGYPGSPSASAYWDIMDSSGPLGNESPDGSPDIHVPGACSGTSTTIDQVDNCIGGWSFSRIFGDLTSGGGPFDPSYAFTLYSDGRLNSSDAPMPPLKIVFNSSGGMGGFTDSYLNRKGCIYNRSSDVTANQCVTLGSGHEDDPHNLYSPYYYSYIPATSRDPFGSASGTDGPIYTDLTGQPNNFPGYGWYGPYDFWQIAGVGVQNESVATPCLLTGDVYRYTNGYPTQVTEFTDNHGEARADWQPGWNADFFANEFVDQNGGCDLQGVSFPHQTITVKARYPFQPVANDVSAPESITKVIENDFQKSVSCERKNNTSSAIVYICTATAQDIAGNGDVFNGETVCFSREPTGTWYDVGGSVPYSDVICRELSGGTSDTPASVSVETPATLVGTQVDVSANFAGEHLWRDACVVVGNSASTDGPCGSSSSGTTGSTSGGSTTGSTSGSSTSGTTGDSGPTTLKNHKAHQTAAVSSVRLVLTSHGRVLYVKVSAPRTMKTAKIHISLLSAKSHLIKSANRTVKTNRLVKVSNLRIGTQVKHVNVKIVR